MHFPVVAKPILREVPTVPSAMKPTPSPKRPTSSRPAVVAFAALVLLAQFTGCATGKRKVPVDAAETGGPEEKSEPPYVGCHLSNRL